jgi:hypothetical protein
VLARVEGKAFGSNPAVVVEYLKALVATERLNAYADNSATSAAGAPGARAGAPAAAAVEAAATAASSSSSSSSSAAAAAPKRGPLAGLGPVPAAGQDHRSLITLLQELQGMAGGGGPGGAGAREEPGSSLRRPLHVVLAVRARVRVCVAVCLSPWL